MKNEFAKEEGKLEEQKVYQLCDSYFQVKAKKGVLTSIMPGSAQEGQRETQYILPGEAFGRIALGWKQDGKEENFIFGRDSAEDETPVCVKDSYSRTLKGCHYEASYSREGDAVAVSVSYELAEGVLRQKFSVKNCSDSAVVLEDVGFPLPCNTDFHWGESACAKVIGHNFTGGHGSHYIFERCDGQGPYLMLLPQNGTSLEFIGTTSSTVGKYGFDNKDHSVYTVYAHSARVRKEDEKAGAHFRLPVSEKTLQPGEEETFQFLFTFARNEENARELLCEHGLVDVQIAPGLTVPAGMDVHLAFTSRWEDLKLVPAEGGEVLEEKRKGDSKVFRLRWNQLGEKVLRVEYAGGRYMNVEFFVTQDLETLLNKRGAFITKCQHKDPSKWYYGLLSEWNNETGVLLGPDNYDKIGGWRIYEVTCDDPGLGKPAFLSGKLAVLPNKEEVAALDLYVENFVWGGLQCTEEEEFPYGIYGIPDWKVNRDSKDPGLKGNLHIWRIYDYPHITWMYYNLYRIARDYKDMPLSQNKETYLRRAYRTAVAMFTIPLELDEWSAYKTGLYNELVIEDVIKALREEGMEKEAARLELHWVRKTRFFAMECTDVFGSEYPFDTTGFESTHALARRALAMAEDVERENRFNPPLTLEQAWSFMENQLQCNIACRGVMEPTYYWYGSDYRSSNLRYTLSYMSQMGGWSILDYALYLAKDPFPLLRLGYGSMLSSWALLNAGEEKDNYGYWFPGKEHDGAASGGYEPQTRGSTWLDQPHHGGPWYYSCEIDLGYCGYLRGAATVAAKDPIFGEICYGGTAKWEEGKVSVIPQDGVQRRFHYVTEEGRFHLLLEEGRLLSVELDPNTLTAVCKIQVSGLQRSALRLQIQKDGFGGEEPVVNIKEFPLDGKEETLTVCISFDEE